MQITLELQGEVAALDPPALPLQGLKIVAGPSVSSEFRWTNGRTSRRKRIEYTAVAMKSGPASVGPLTLRAGTQQVTFPRVDLNVKADVALEGTSSEILSKMIGGGEDLAVIAEAPPGPFVVGQQVVMRWFLYSSRTIHSLRLSEISSASGFWSEVDRSKQESQVETVLVRGMPFQKVLVRQASLFPLRAGSLEVARVQVIIEVLDPLEDAGGFGSFNRSASEKRRRSQALALSVLPAAPDAGAVGSYRMQCVKPILSSTGQTSVTVAVRGDGNLRLAEAPELVGPVDGEFTVDASSVRVVHNTSGVTMERTWNFVIRPNSAGAFRFPAIRFNSWDPATKRTSTLMCAGSVLNVPDIPRQSEVNADNADSSARGSRISFWTASTTVMSAVAIAIVLALLVASLLILRRRGRNALPLTLAQLVPLISEPASLMLRVDELIALVASRKTAREMDVIHDERESLQSAVALMRREPWRSEELLIRIEERLRKLYELLR